MTLLDALLIVLAGLAAGTINTVVGSGTLITFPTLVVLGVPPVVANVSNTIGLVAGGLTGVAGYRREISGSVRELLRLVPMSFLGGLTGALLLLVLPADAFSAIVPVLIILGITLVVFGPRLSAMAATHRAADSGGWHQWALAIGIFLAGVYGGYFGAAQGVILMGILSILTTEHLQRLNGWKNVLGTVANGVAALVFVIAAPDQVNWAVAGLIAVGALIGGVVGSTIGRRLSPSVLRAVIVVMGTAALVKFLAFP
ncbi:MAG: sulfite exporter TauE/SafE family protein [Phycicoccus sp.]|nr:sulfite exporter TauE/SafE family protein [Phycicoccus sp.]